MSFNTFNFIAKRKRMIFTATLLINNRGGRGFPAYCSFIWTVAYRCGFGTCLGGVTPLAVATMQGLTGHGNERDRLGIIHCEVVMKCGTQIEVYPPSAKAFKLTKIFLKVQDKQNMSEGQLEYLAFSFSFSTLYRLYPQALFSKEII